MKTKTTEEKIVSGGKAIATVVKVVITIGVGLAAPTVLGTCLGAGAGFGAMVYTMAWFAGGCGIATEGCAVGMATVAVVGTAAGGTTYYFIDNVIDDCFGHKESGETSLTGDHSHSS